MSCLLSKQVNREKLEQQTLIALRAIKLAVDRMGGLVTAIAIAWQLDTDDSWSKGRVALIGAIDDIFNAVTQVTSWAHLITKFKPEEADSTQKIAFVESWAEFMEKAWGIVEVWRLIHKFLLASCKACKETGLLVYNGVCHVQIASQRSYDSYYMFQDQFRNVICGNIIPFLFPDSQIE
jgi:hypothetical protein